MFVGLSIDVPKIFNVPRQLFHFVSFRCSMMSLRCSIEVRWIFEFRWSPFPAILFEALRYNIYAKPAQHMQPVHSDKQH
jgi:hypothetical protein